MLLWPVWVCFPPHNLPPPPRVHHAECLQVLIAAHGNSLRALVKYLDDVSEADITELNIPTGEPFRSRPFVALTMCA
jgi:hypothetical protein